ncbi:aminoglycoside phosphotransferase family protein [Nocardia thailandica]|uniref:Aminoglycoside phosphotransferase family protein n=1 Tax=Nocardia thailandica TaxID=257275 RepID=A0ABW6PUF1_9NOCA
MSPVCLPSEVAETIRAVFGPAGERWIEELPAIVDALCVRWDLVARGAPFSGGTHAYVAPVRRSGGSEAVLKVPLVDEENRAEASALYVYGGDGAVRLYAYDPGTGAMLIERACGPELLRQPGFPSLEGRAENAGLVELGCSLYRRLRRPPGALPAGFPALPAAVSILDQVVAGLAAPGVGAVVDASLRARVRQARALLRSPAGPGLVVNRDTHLGNILAARREPWLLIDPKPYLGEAAFDAGFLVMIQVQSDPAPAHAAAVVERTAAALGVDPARARAWALVRAVEEIVWAVEDSDAELLPLHTAVASALGTPAPATRAR